jgi:hypothetical protein
LGMSEARRRFAQYAVLRAIASSARLSELSVFKGGDALDLRLEPEPQHDRPRLLSGHAGGGAAALDEARLEGMLSRALDVSGRESGVVLRVHSVRRQPPG